MTTAFANQYRISPNKTNELNNRDTVIAMLAEKLITQSWLLKYLVKTIYFFERKINATNSSGAEERLNQNQTSTVGGKITKLPRNKKVIIPTIAFIFIKTRFQIKIFYT